MSKKKSKPKYDPFKALHPQSINRDLEDLAKRLFELSTKGSKPIWDELKAGNMKEDLDLKRRFLASSHARMNEAQKTIVEIIQSNQTLTNSQTILIQGIADSMAWQLIGNQLCYARRFYKGHKPVNLKQSNFDSVVLAANQTTSKDPGSFALISDLTSFVQVGDLLTMGSLGGLTIGEVKEGRKNHEILDFMNFFTQSGCPRAFQYFAQEHGDSGIKQLQRMFRQAERMGHVTEVMSKGRSLDPDTNQKISIPEEFIYIQNWDSELNSILEDSDSKGWALNVIDDCLFIASYSKDAMQGHGHGMFNMWFDQFEGTANCPRARLIDSMSHPLAIPIFNLNISDEHKFDILFGRKNVCIGLNISALLKKLRKVGLKVREATNKEASTMDQQGFPPYRHNGKAIFIGNEQREMLLMDGIFLRVLFHSQRPVETIQAILNSSPELAP
ncbi:hypothetical protein PSH97_17630 [Pseudomonas cucumis]|uniref:Uncharacterized protein n=1 Tax=Pseudomonas cucumis TaxID=2954082 RepID=A0ABY9EQT2_9PSED|nr:hypothetical protein [Pseudomonas cucumis]WLG82939.1 hypothetical protein PSH97_17630 [Pseudomonas cucumis]